MSAITGQLRRSASDAPHGDPDSAPLRRRVGRRLPAPNRRAVIGGLLVALAAVGLVVSQRSTDANAGQRVLIARRAIAPGSTIVADDLGWVTMSLYDGTARRVFSAADALIGRVASVPIRTDELISTSMLAARSPGSPAGRRVTLDLAAAGALDGALVAGDRVDVVASGDVAGSSEVIARDAMVARVPDADVSGGIGGTDRRRITVVVADEATAVALLDASATRKVSLIGATAAPEGGGDGGS